MTRFESHDGVYVIAEIGINHNGSLEEAKSLLRAAVAAGADGVKIQARQLDALYTETVLQDSRTAEQGTQYLLSEIRRSNLSPEGIRELFDYAKQFDVDFFATPFDIPSVQLLTELKTPLFKIGSPDLTNLPLLDVVAGCDAPMILSTGMATEEEIVSVVQFLRRREARFSLLHCNSTYPASPESINLNYLSVLKELSGVRVGYSGHERGYLPTLASVALGATIIERHITTDTTQQGPDHDASLNCDDFAAMVHGVREIEKSLGKAERSFGQGERNNRTALAKSLVAARDLEKGEVLTQNDLIAKSPARGVSPLERDNYIGKTLTRTLKRDAYISPEYITCDTQTGRTSFEINKHWGVVGRLNDFEEFLSLSPELIEIHMTWRDLFAYQRPAKTFEQDLVIHAPEYYQDKLIDFTSDDADVTESSLEMLRLTVQIARDLAPQFRGMSDSRGPRVVVHPGGHFQALKSADKESQYRRLMRNLRSVDTEGVRILVENMPPLPWYFGGQWYNTVFMDAAEIAQFAREMQWEICFDTSHAQLFCSHAKSDLADFTRTILDHIGYLHIADARGATEEGLQIGQGVVDFEQIFAILDRLDVGFIPEIWQGHLDGGRGFVEALESIETILHKVSGSSCSAEPNSRKSKSLEKLEQAA